MPRHRHQPAGPTWCAPSPGTSSSRRPAACPRPPASPAAGAGARSQDRASPSELAAPWACARQLPAPRWTPSPSGGARSSCRSGRGTTPPPASASSSGHPTAHLPPAQDTRSRRTAGRSCSAARGAQPQAFLRPTQSRPPERQPPPRYRGRPGKAQSRSARPFSPCLSSSCPSSSRWRPPPPRHRRNPSRAESTGRRRRDWRRERLRLQVAPMPNPPGTSVERPSRSHPSRARRRRSAPCSGRNAPRSGSRPWPPWGR
mmetsp:Transcript_133030/g.384777  ORF Transcript_133030/g.384777 Transcript_133030/m.384777 type:complete len:258 (+) Transcript_133030:698-1471(+)